MSTSTHATPHSHPAICVKTNAFLSHLAWIRQLKPALLNRRTDNQCCVSSQWDWYPPLPPGDENILSWAHPLPHHTTGAIAPRVQKPGSVLCPVLSLCTATILPDLEILGCVLFVCFGGFYWVFWLLFFFPLLACSLGIWAQGLVAWSCWQSTEENKAHMHF